MIFNLFKSKPTLKDLIPKGFVDIHSHILPGIDDGAKNIGESLKLISEMKKMGFNKIIATPHTYPGLYNNTNDSITKAYDILISNKKLDKKNDIFFASEYMIDRSLTKKASEKQILTINKKFILIEMSFAFMHNFFYEIIFELQSHGYEIILAHPERYRFLIQNFKEYYKLKDHGCYFQLNLLSLVNYYGNDVTKISDWLIKERMIDFLGSDLHNINQLSYFENKIKIKELEILTKVFNKNIILN